MRQPARAILPLEQIHRSAQLTLPNVAELRESHSLNEGADYLGRTLPRDVVATPMATGWLNRRGSTKPNVQIRD